MRIADDAHAAAATNAIRLAATHQLHADHQSLTGTLTVLDHIGTLCREANMQLDVLARSHRSWHAHATDWHTAHAAAELAARQLDEAEAEHSTRAMRLATLEDAIGTDYQEVLASLVVSRADLDNAQNELATAREAKEAAVVTTTNTERDARDAAAELDEARTECVAVIEPTRRALGVPGLLDAASMTEQDDDTWHPSVPAVDDSPSGARPR